MASQYVSPYYYNRAVRDPIQIPNFEGDDWGGKIAIPNPKATTITEPMTLIGSLLNRGYGCNTYIQPPYYISYHSYEKLERWFCRLFNCDFVSCRLGSAQLGTCYVSDTVMINCFVRNCFIGAKSTVVRCNLFNCTIMEVSSVQESVVDKCVLIGVKITRGEMRDTYCFESKVQKSVIRDCKLDEVQIGDTKVYSSTLRYCSIDKARGSSELLNSLVDDCKEITSGTTLRDCTVKTKPLALRRFTPEMRELIYMYAICGGRNWVNWTIAGQNLDMRIIAALRGEPKLYHEAFDVLRNNFVYTITRADWWTVKINGEQ